ncbi:jabba [Carabus blaptoides fortunei]
MAELNDEAPATMCQKMYLKSCDLLEETAECIASWQIGQTILKHADRCLWSVEKCAEWSLPNTQVPKHNGTQDTFGDGAPLVRPLPWALFLPMLIFLRCIRACVNTCAILIGVELVKPAGVVKFIQVRRRRVRALKFMGLRRMRQRKLSQQLQAIAAPTWQKRINNLLSGVMCFKVVHNDVSEAITSNDVFEENANSSSKSDLYLKRKYVEILKYDLLWDNVDDDEELMEKIDKLVKEGNAADPDFMPVEEDSQSEDDSLSEGEDTASSSQAKQSHSSRNYVTNESIEEENEDSDDSSTVSANSEEEERTELKSTPTNRNITVETTDAQVNSIEPESNVDEFYSPRNSISVTPEPPRNLDQDSAICSAKTLPEKCSSKSGGELGNIQTSAEASEKLIQDEKNEVNVQKNENSPNSHDTKHETFVVNEKSSQANSTNNHKENVQS